MPLSRMGHYMRIAEMPATSAMRIQLASGRMDFCLENLLIRVFRRPNLVARAIWLLSQDCCHIQRCHRPRAKVPQSIPYPSASLSQTVIPFGIILNFLFIHYAARSIYSTYSAGLCASVRSFMETYRHFRREHLGQKFLLRDCMLHSPTSNEDMRLI